MWKGFRQFILKGNAIDLAVGIVIGAAFTQVVNSLVKGLINPFIGLFGGEPNFNWVVSIHNSKFLVGDFLSTVIAFLINAAVIYFFVVSPVNHLMQRVKSGKSEDPTEKKCTECLSLIPIDATRCKFCSSVQDKKT